MYLLPVRCWLICIICKQAYSTNENNNYIYMTMASLSACARACVCVNAAGELLTMAPPAVAEEKGETRRLRSRKPLQHTVPSYHHLIHFGTRFSRGFQSLPTHALSTVEHACVEHSIRICQGSVRLHTLLSLSHTQPQPLVYLVEIQLSRRRRSGRGTKQQQSTPGGNTSQRRYSSISASR
uniref:Putative secreted protein n=1 Tax=Anopheles triannulatus TaxID=58253 RepID=A0A2M4B515_9DIPT